MTKTECQIAAFTACVLIVIANAVAHAVWYPKREFDRTVWLDDSPHQIRRKQQMADWLMAQNRLVGQKRADIVEQLGEPSFVEIFNDWHVAYWLGRERTFVGVTSEWLVMRYGEDDRVFEACIVRR